MRMKFRLAAVLALVVSMFSAAIGTSAFHDGSDHYHQIATPEFEVVWERTDLPVQQLEVARTWLWGPAGFSDLIVEDYAEGEGGTRQVQYFDKSRMEMPTLGAADPQDEESLWLITQGLLASELMTGRLQLGDDTFEQYQPSQRSAAGDPADVTAPTYAVMGEQMDRAPRAGGDTVIEHIDRDGNITSDADRFMDYGVTDVDDAYTPVPGIDKNIASVFWDLMTSDGLVYENGKYVEDQPIVLNPFYAVGYPLTDAFWADVMVDGVVQNVLIQAFERRVLTYTPGNPGGWEVESGNIGQHYYDWRYRQIPDEPVINVELEFEPYDPDSVVEPTLAGADIAILTDFEPQNFALTTASLVDQHGNPIAIEGEDIEFSATAANEDTRVRGGDGFWPTLEGETEEYFTGPEATKPLVATTDADGEAFLYFRRSLGPEVGMHNGLIDITATHVETGASDTVTVQFIEGDDVVRDDHDDDHH